MRCSEMSAGMYLITDEGVFFIPYINGGMALLRWDDHLLVFFLEQWSSS